MPPTNLILRNTQSPGDIVVLSATIRDLHIAHPGRYNTAINVSPGAEHIFQHNPNIAQTFRGNGRRMPGWKTMVAHYPLVQKSNQERKHFLWGFLEDMNKRLKTNIKLTKFQPDLYLSEEEKMTPPIEPPYWVFLSGGKTDFRTKIWSQSYWQQVIDMTKDKIRWVQCGGGSKNHIEHIPKRGIYANMIAKTQMREFMRLIYHSDGVVSVVTAAMHIAAGFNKPCVVIAGSREPWWWALYTEENRLLNMRQVDPLWLPPKNDLWVPHKGLHTMDQLPCCKNKGCWKAKLKGGRGACKNIVTIDGQRLPKCKALVTPEMVVDAIYDYYKEGRIRQGRMTVEVDHSSLCFVFYSADGSFEAPTAYSDAPHQIVADASVGRAGALRAAKKTGADWVVWLEKPGRVGSLFAIECGGADKAVRGRLYKDKHGKIYPHPSFFVAPTELLGDGERFKDFFAGLDETQFRPLGSMATIPEIRPEDA